MRDRYYGTTIDRLRDGTEAYEQFSKRVSAPGPELPPEEEPSIWEKIFQPNSPRVRAWRQRQMPVSTDVVTPPESEREPIPPPKEYTIGPYEPGKVELEQIIQTHPLLATLRKGAELGSQVLWPSGGPMTAAAGAMGKLPRKLPKIGGTPLKAEKAAAKTATELPVKQEIGQPEAGIQEGLFGQQVEVRPKGKGVVTQVSMDDALKMEQTKASELPAATTKPAKALESARQEALDQIQKGIDLAKGDSQRARDLVQGNLDLINTEMGNRSIPFHGGAKSLFSGTNTKQLEEQAKVYRGWLDSTKPPAPSLAGQGIEAAGTKEPVIAAKAAGEVPPVVPPKPPVATGGIPPGELPVPTPEDSVNSLVALVHDIDAKTLRRQTEIIRTMERKQRAGMVASALESGKGEQAFIRAKGQLKGRLSYPEIIAPEKQLQPQDIFNLNELIRQSNQRPFTKLSTQEALAKLLGGELPTRNEMVLLEEVFGVELAKELLKKRALGSKVYETFLDAVGLFKALKASTDISAPARQGMLLFGEQSWWTSWKPMLKAFAKEEEALASIERIKSNPLYPLLEKTNTYIAPYGKEAIKLTMREESFMSRLAQKIPWVKWSERAYVTYLNELRANTVFKYAKEWQDLPIPKTELNEKLNKLGDFINRATGRGNLGALGKGELPVIGNALFFSPRFVASRFQAPFHVFSSDANVRKIVAKNVASFVGAGLGVMTLAALGGAEVETDPRSSDFGKIRIGNTRWDVWAGFQQIARYGAQFITATRKAVDTGRNYPTTRLEVAQRFVESKLSPAAGLLISALSGQNFIGEPMELSTETLRREAWNAVIPMFVSDLVDAVREEGLIGVALAAPGAIGVSVTTYPARGKPEWQPDIQKYLDIPTDPLERREKKITMSREQYRERHPDVDAKLFITGQVSSIQSLKAYSEVKRLLAENKIDPMTINKVRTWSADENARRLKQGLKDTLTDRLIKDLLKGR